MRVIIRIAMAVLIFLALVVVGLGVLLYTSQEKLMYFPSAYTEWELQNARELGLIQVQYSTDQGRQAAFYLPPAGAPKATGKPPEKLWLVHCGNGSRVLDLLPLFTGLPSTGAAYGVLMLDYPGYGLNEGRPNPGAIKESDHAALRKLWEDFSWAGDPVTGEGLSSPVAFSYLGHSLGCAGVMQLAASLGRAESVILLSPFTSMREMANQRVSPLFSWLLTHEYDNRANLAQLMGSVSPQPKVTLVHGTLDVAIPVTMSRRLAAEHPGAITLVELPQADHNDFVFGERALIQGLILGRQPTSATAP